MDSREYPLTRNVNSPPYTFNSYSEDDKEEEEEEDEGEEEEEEVGPALGSLWPHIEGDALSRLRAMGAFAYTSTQGP